MMRSKPRTSLKLLLIVVFTMAVFATSALQRTDVAEAATPGVGQTFAQVFPNAHTADVVSAVCGATATDTITSTMVQKKTLNLAGSNLTDITGIDVFSNLSSLYLQDNHLTTLPDGIGSLSNLSLLNIADNDCTTLPDSFANLSQLYQLYAPNNEFTTLPACVTSLSSKLHYLYMSGNKLTTLPDSIGQLSALTYLYLSDNKLTTLPSSIGNLSSLVYLDLKNNNLTALPESIGNLPTLWRLFVDNNSLTALPDSIGNLSTNLLALSASGNDITSLPASFTNLTSLWYLYLNNNRLMNLTQAQYKCAASAKYAYQLGNQTYSQSEKSRYAGVDYVFDTLPIYGQVQTYQYGSTITYQLTRPDGTIIDESNLINPAIGGPITLDKTLLQQAGTYIFSATLTNGALGASKYTQTFVLEAAPAINPVHDNDASITGTAEPGSSVTVTDATTGKAIGTATAGADGTWSLAIPAGASITAGDTISATARDGAGNVSGPATTVVIDATAPAAPAINPVHDNDASITGTAEPGSSVTVTDATTGKAIGTATAGADGTWSLTIPAGASITAGDTISATARDGAGNVSGPATTTVVGTTVVPTSSTSSTSSASSASSASSVPNMGDGNESFSTLMEVAFFLAATLLFALFGKHQHRSRLH
jgi:hypothetical protein